MAITNMKKDGLLADFSPLVCSPMVEPVVKTKIPTADEWVTKLVSGAQQALSTSQTDKERAEAEERMEELLIFADLFDVNTTKNDLEEIRNSAAAYSDGYMLDQPNDGIFRVVEYIPGSYLCKSPIELFINASDKDTDATLKIKALRQFYRLCDRKGAKGVMGAWSLYDGNERVTTHAISVMAPEEIV